MDKEKKFQLESDGQLTRLASNFFQDRTKGEYSENDVNVVKEFFYYALNSKPTKKYKVALCFICLNPPYWEFISKAIEGAKKFFLPDHQVDYFLWSDVPSNPELIKQKIAEGYLQRGEVKASLINSSSAAILMDDNKSKEMEKMVVDLMKVRNEVNFFEIEPVEWPLPTLLRYHLFLQQEEKLKEYDYIFYCDIDMMFANYVGDEILGEGITAALHPMYALRNNYNAPYEPNPESAAHIPFNNTYYAGGFQGGKANKFIEAMKAMRKTIDHDLDRKNYTARWNDESHFNKYLRDNPPSITLSPAYIYPDSLISEYYIKLWGRNYSPKIITLTKRFSVSRQAGEEIRKQMETL
jgi:hypothetical protein